MVWCIGYVVEKCEEGSSVWERVPGVVNGTSHTVKDLEPGKKYKFRVKAENMYGTGEPVETDRSILAKNPFGLFVFYSFLLMPSCILTNIVYSSCTSSRL